MRTTLDIDERVLVVARALARDEGISIGAAVSELARRGLDASTAQHTGLPRLGDPGGVPITLDIVNAHRD